MEKYFYSVNKTTGACRDLCIVKRDGTYIGSASCKICPHCMGFDQDEDWIKCQVLDKAIGKELTHGVVS